ncbi:MAG: hypothetical protein KJZ87_29135 [Thermoguttaceae bacterium]|nr:hypothetical protein [Thermoguttaceae bacterium]
MDLKTRIARLEAAVESRNTGIRIAGKSWSEIYAEMLVHLFCRLESGRAGLAAAFVAAAKSERPLEGPKEIAQWVTIIREIDQRNPGLPARVLEAVLSGADAITEEMLYPTGRPDSEETHYSRQGKRFLYRLDALDQD